jgi:hypothetical protein
MFIISYSFFVFLGIYVVTELIISLFLTLDFNMRFIVYLTPFFILNMSAIQLYVLSAFVTAIDAYLHLFGGKREIAWSLIPSIFILSGLTLAVYLYEYNNIFYYIVYSLSIVFTVMDYQYARN